VSQDCCLGEHPADTRKVTLLLDLPDLLSGYKI
jgi:hypothetical protein